MKSEEKRLKIIEAGAQLIHQKGFNNTGLKEIVDAVGIPKGSFYYFFENKEDFGLQVIGYFSGFFSQTAAQCLQAPKEQALEKLEDLFRFFEGYFEEHNYSCGCPIGNLAQEMGSINEKFASRLEGVFTQMRDSLLLFLEEAAAKQEIPAENASVETANFILDSWEGTLLRMKVQRSIVPLIKWRSFICRSFLKIPHDSES